MTQDNRSPSREGLSPELMIKARGALRFAASRSALTSAEERAILAVLAERPISPVGDGHPLAPTASTSDEAAHALNRITLFLRRNAVEYPGGDVGIDRDLAALTRADDLAAQLKAERDAERAKPYAVDMRRRALAAEAQLKAVEAARDEARAIAVKCRLETQVKSGLLLAAESRLAGVVGALREIINGQVGDVINFRRKGQSHDNFVSGLVEALNRANNIAREALKLAQPNGEVAPSAKGEGE
jgi:hypothetical protein